LGSTINKKRVVVSAINFSEGGPLTVFQDCLSVAVTFLPPEWDIVALVHNKASFNQSRVQFVEFPKAKRSWLLRLCYEWIFFSKLSKKIKPDLWLSLHDITPRVSARRQVVYCHNPAPFYRISWREIKLSPVFWLFTLLYKYLYRIFIKRNSYVIVQQDWIRNAFIGMYEKLPIVVAYPSVSSVATELNKSEDVNTHIFLYPSFPRVFKNFEVICEAAKVLESRNIYDFEVRITLSGFENAYAKSLYEAFKDVKSIHFIGLQSKANLAMQYQLSTAIVFPSKLETWGLPISEAKLYNKKLLLADLPYAHETVGTYDKVSFFLPTDGSKLADLMQAIIEGRWQPTGFQHNQPSQPFVHNWDDLWAMLIKGL
jgi:hypothetical protein